MTEKPLIAVVMGYCEPKKFVAVMASFEVGTHTEELAHSIFFVAVVVASFAGDDAQQAVVVAADEPFVPVAVELS